jgi:hypothetical protein
MKNRRRAKGLCDIAQEADPGGVAAGKLGSRLEANEFGRANGGFRASGVDQMVIGAGVVAHIVLDRRGNPAGE